MASRHGVPNLETVVETVMNLRHGTLDTQPKLCKYENMFATVARPLQTLSALGSRARSFSSVNSHVDFFPSNPRVPVVNRPSARRHARVQASICPIIDTKKCVREWRVVVVVETDVGWSLG